MAISLALLVAEISNRYYNCEKSKTSCNDSELLPVGHHCVHRHILCRTGVDADLHLVVAVVKSRGERSHERVSEDVQPALVGDSSDCDLAIVLARSVVLAIVSVVFGGEVEHGEVKLDL